MAADRIDRIAESSLFKVASAVLTSVLTAAVLGVGGSLVDRLGRVEAQLAEAKTDKATTEIRVRQLEALVPELRKAQDQVLLLSFRVQDLETRANAKGTP